MKKLTLLALVAAALVYGVAKNPGPVVLRDGDPPICGVKGLPPCPK